MSLPSRWHLLARDPLICAVVMIGLVTRGAEAQLAPEPSPSPLAPGDLRRPIFDTRTPIYDTVDSRATSAGTIIAEVDGRPVTLGDVQDVIAKMPPTMKDLPFAEIFPGVQERLVREQALVIRAQHESLDETPSVRRKVKAASDRVMADALLEHEISRSITEAALLERYNKDLVGRPGPEEVHVLVIMVPTEKQAIDIIGELLKGMDFASLAKRSSMDTTASAGGDAGFVLRENLTPEIGAVVFSMQLGQVTAFPVRSVGSWFVLKVQERRSLPTRSFSVEREGLRQAMLREGVADVAKKALADVTVRQFDFTGKETAASSADAGVRTSR